MYIQLYKPGYFHPIYRYLVSETDHLPSIIAHLDIFKEASKLKNRGYFIYKNRIKDNEILGEYK